MEKEQSLERDKVQLGLDWQRRCEGLERDHYQQSEGLVQGLASARAQVRCGVSEAVWALSFGNTGPHGAVGLNIESCGQCVPALPTSLARVSLAVSPTDPCWVVPTSTCSRSGSRGGGAGRDGYVQSPAAAQCCRDASHHVSSWHFSLDISGCLLGAGMD